MDVSDRLAAFAGRPAEPFPATDLWSGEDGWRRLSARVEARALSRSRPLAGEGERIHLSGAPEDAIPESPLAERPRYVVRARDVFLAGQRALIDDSEPGRPRLANDALLLPPPFFDHARALSAFPHEFRMNPWIARDGETLRLEPQPGGAVEIAEPVIAVSSTEIRNYGSWLFRIVPKLVLLGELGPEADGRALFVPVEQPWMRELATFFAPGRRIVPQDPTRLHHLSDALVPSLPAAGNVFPAAVRERLSHLADRNDGDAGGGDERIYVSRRRFSERVPRRVLLNEAEIADTLSSLGFREVFPEDSPLSERVALFSRARIVVGPTGSALFNTVFCRSKALVIELEPHGEFRAMHAALYRSLGLRHAFLRGSVVAAGTGHAHPDWIISPQLCRQALEKLLPRR